MNYGCEVLGKLLKIIIYKSAIEPNKIFNFQLSIDFKLHRNIPTNPIRRQNPWTRITCSSSCKVACIGKIIYSEFDLEVFFEFISTAKIKNRISRNFS